jgi:hypothetical protein
MTTRRHVLQLFAAAPALAACGDAGPDPATAWRNPGAGEYDPRRFALAHAILAPNPHNTQAWQVSLEGDDAITLYCDLARRLPFTDPKDRQITLGCGAFLELYRIAAAQLGRAVQIEPFPEGEPTPRLDDKPIARARFMPQANAAPDALFRHITSRRTNRNVYDAERAPADVTLLRATNFISNFVGAAQWTVAPARVAGLRDLVWRAFDRELRTPGAQRETYRWLRFGREEARRQGDGLAIDAPMAPLMKSLGFLGEDDFVDPNSFANKQAASDWRAKAESAPAFMWLSTVSDSPTSRLIAGMAYARLNLAAASFGLAMHPWSQALQEYPEMADLYAEAREKLETGDQTAQMLVRVGYADPVAPSPRRGVEAILRRA